MRKKDRPNIELVLAVIERVARPEIRKKYDLASCIASTRIVIDVLGRYGIRAVPRAVTTKVEKGGATGYLGGSERRTRGLWKGTSAGHVIAVIPERNLLLDASIDQVRAQHPRLEPPCPFIAEVSDGFIDRSKGAYFLFDGYEMFYVQDRLPKRIRQTPDWQSRSYNRSVINGICARIESARAVSLEEFQRRVGARIRRERKSSR